MTRRAPRWFGLALLALGLASSTAAAKPRDRQPPRIVHTPVGTVSPERPIEIRAEAFDQVAVYEVSLWFRNRGEVDYVRAVMVDTGRDYLSIIPAELVRQDLEYYIEAFDVLGNGPARIGSPEQPLYVHVTAEPLAVPPPMPEVADTTAEGQSGDGTGAKAATGLLQEGARPRDRRQGNSSGHARGEGLGERDWLGWGTALLGAASALVAATFVVDFLLITRPQLAQAKRDFDAYYADPRHAPACPNGGGSNCWSEAVVINAAKRNLDFIGMASSATVAAGSAGLALWLLSHSDEGREDG